jgi:molecular chaperone HscB
MNYFQFFDIPASLDVDLKLLKQRFYANSKKFHPDFFTLDDVEKQMEALEVSTMNNKAYNTLLDFEKRIKYILDLYDVLEEEGNNKLSQDFLMDMMDVNEAVMELQFDFAEDKFVEILEHINVKGEKLRSGINGIIPKNINDLSESDFKELKNYYLKNKYLLRLSENINKLKP